GRNISGKAIFGNMVKMPHILVAGTTGSGKSVTIHSMITSLLYRNGPDDLKLILIDPKRVELTLYNNIPHLLTPVITEAKKTILALKWAAKEMDRRYDILEAESVRDIESYHSNVFNKNPKKKRTNGDGVEEEVNADRLPYIIIIIDELADIMSIYPRELESAIVRLAQMSRAVGIHLILSTQRPEVNIITGLIKANIPARVALKVSSQVDSRTILDAGGAEKLLGAGDMLYSSGEAQPERLQSAFISESEVKKVVKYLADSYQDEVSEEITLTPGSIGADKSIFESSLENENTDDDDEMYEEARVCVMEAGKASTSYLQRKLRLGYARAARLMDKLEERGVIGPGDGAKPREVLEKIERTENDENVI
ncbi:MAG: DNA translocase FtsK, partial [bacterium]